MTRTRFVHPARSPVSRRPPRLKAALYLAFAKGVGVREAQRVAREIRAELWGGLRRVLRNYLEIGGSRTRFRRLSRDAAARRFEVVLFWSLDRLSREGAFQTLRHLNTLAAYEVGFLSHAEPYLDSCGVFRDAIIVILGMVTKQERLRITERVKAGLETARKNGTPIGRPRRVVGTKCAQALRAKGLSYREAASKLGLGEGRHASDPKEAHHRVRSAPIRFWRVHRHRCG